MPASKACHFEYEECTTFGTTPLISYIHRSSWEPAHIICLNHTKPCHAALHYVIEITHDYSTSHCSTSHYTALHYITSQCSTSHYSKVQYSTVQYSTVQYSTVQYMWPCYLTVSEMMVGPAQEDNISKYVTVHNSTTHCM